MREMDEYSLQITPEAESDIGAAYDYIAYHLENQQAAFELTDGIYAAIEELASMPLRFPVWRHEPMRSQGVRSYGVKNFNVSYYINEPLHAVIVVRVLYNRRNA